MVVLPTDPVMPTTRVGSRRARASRPTSSSAPPVSSTTIAVPPRRRPRVRYAAAPAADRGGDEVVTVALGDDRHEQLAAAERRDCRWRRPSTSTSGPSAPPMTGRVADAQTSRSGVLGA